MNFYAFFCCEMFLVICRRCQLSDGDDDDCDGRELLRLVCKGSRDTPTLPARLSRTALSLFLFARALSLSHGIPKCVLSSSPSPILSLFASCFVLCKLLATLFECLVVSAFKTFQFAVALSLYALTLTRTVLSHSFSLSVSLSVSLQSLLSFCKNGCLCCACSLSVGVVVVVAVGRNTVELEQQFAAI